jgi:hypothetical protein
MKHAPIRVSIGGGKGGVGKSVVAANLACALAALGAAHGPRRRGSRRPEPPHPPRGDERGPDAPRAPRAPHQPPRGGARGHGDSRACRSSPVPAACPGTANPSHQEKLKLLRQIASLDADAVVIDVGAGTSYKRARSLRRGAGAADRRDAGADVAPERVRVQQGGRAARESRPSRSPRASSRPGRRPSITARRAACRAGSVVSRARKRRWPRASAATSPRPARPWSATASARRRTATRSSRSSRLGREFLDVELPDRRDPAELSERPRQRPAPPSGRLRCPGRRPAREGVLSPRRARRDERARRTRCGGPSRRSASSRRRTTGSHSRGSRLSSAPGSAREARVTVSLACVVRGPRGHEEGVVVDLSPGGARVASALAVHVGDRVEISVVQGSQEVTLGGTVRHAARDSFGLAPRAGLRGRASSV